VDRCIECGFCEPACPSRRLTLTPRQRIAVRREMARQEQHGVGEILRELQQDFEYAGIDTCAADGLCATVCPVKIDTGHLVKRLRGEKHGPRARRAARWVARRFGAMERLGRLAVRAGHLAERLGASGALRALARGAGSLLGVRLPLWSAAIPRVPRRAPVAATSQAEAEAVYVPTCLSRMLGRPRGDERSLPEVMRTLAERAGVRLWTPSGCEGSCCGLPFGSKGFTQAHADLLEALVERLWSWSDRGRLPIVLDASSCLQSIEASGALLSDRGRRRLEELRLIDAIRFAHDTLLPRLDIRRQEIRVALHPTCAARELGIVDEMRRVAERCASEVTVPMSLGCCAMAGDRGLLFPELTASAVVPEAAEVHAGRYQGWYSNNLTCEMGMTQATGLPYVSLLYLIERASAPQSQV